MDIREKEEFEKSNLEKEEFEKSNLEKEAFEKSNLEKEEFEKSNLEKEEFEKSNLEKEEFEKSMKRIRDAHNFLLTRLFGEVPANVGEYTVTRSAYRDAMLKTQKEYGLVEGDPDTILFMFEQLSRSPKFEDRDGGTDDE